jgi:hypothetical protein
MYSSSTLQSKEQIESLQDLHAKFPSVRTIKLQGRITSIGYDFHLKIEPIAYAALALSTREMHPYTQLCPTSAVSALVIAM